ncbi:MAG: DUF1338 domain-containing protein [Bacteroidales bacterium]|nr:DUF1338 domain-containing protein [Bacteroidales bacterium]
MKEAQRIFDKLWEDYTRQNPDAKKIHDLFVEKEGKPIINDHIAFRTFDDERVNIDVLSRWFMNAGYEFKGDYHFEQKHLYAKHFEHKTFRDAPRVFISQLITGDFSDYLREQVKMAVNQIPRNILTTEELIYSGNTWEQFPSHEVYEKLRQESEYAAWLYLYGFRANHFTISITHLDKLDTMQKVNQFLKDHGYLLNYSGGEIKGSPEELLEQSSVKAAIQKRHFKEGEYEVPVTYYEFAKRYKDKNGKLYSGFIAKSADKIFESTDYYKKS